MEYITKRYTACFRQWKAEGTHCRFIHAYRVWFELEFNKPIDDVFNEYPQLVKVFEDYFDNTFNYKTFVAADDPNLTDFQFMYDNKIVDLVVLPQVGCERFSEVILNHMNNYFKLNKIDLKCVMVETKEHEKNSGVAFI